MFKNAITEIYNIYDWFIWRWNDEINYDIMYLSYENADNNRNYKKHLDA